MKRIISLIAALLVVIPIFALCVSADNDVLYFPVDGVNCSRNANMIVVYTCSGARTNTNEWGYEVCVGANGKVISLGGNNNIIPDGGFVISGHGTGRTYLIDHFAMGMNVRFFEKGSTVAVSNGTIPPYFSYTMSISGTNRGRGENELIAYTPAYGTRTRTNEYGYEIVVDSTGYIVSAGGNNNTIPSGGFVLSGHGDAALLLKERAVVGMKFELDMANSRFTITFNERSLVPLLSSAINEMDAVLAQRNADFAVMIGDPVTLLNNIKSEFNQAKNAYEATGDTDLLLSLYDRIDSLADNFYIACAESTGCEYRGVWIRPTERDRASVAETVQGLYDLGCNSVHIETTFSGYLAFRPFEGCLMPLNPYFNGFDVLQAYIEECHARGMELHCWYPNFCVGSLSSCPAFEARPDMFVKDQNGLYYEEGGGDFMFLDPANPDAVNFLLEIYEYLFTHYDIDAFELDYIRYQGYTNTEDWGYYSAAYDEFRGKYGFYPSFNTQAYWWEDWCTIRSTYVTAFVKKVRDLMDRVAPGVILSADVQPGSVYGANNGIYQDSRSWIINGWIDMVHPMTYTENGPQDFTPLYYALNSNTKIASGLGSFVSAISTKMLYDQVSELRYLNAIGTVWFENLSFTVKASQGLIANGVYSVKAPAPARYTTASLMEGVKFMKQRMGVIKDRGVITESKYNECIAVLDDIYWKYAEKGASYSAEAVNRLTAAVSDIRSDAKNILLGDIRQLDRVATISHEDKTADTFDISKGFAYFKPDDTDSVLQNNFKWADYVEKSGNVIATGKEFTVHKDDNAVILTSVIRGDVNGDGRVDTRDYLVLKRYVLGTYDITGAYTEAADVTSDGRVKASDYLILKRHCLGTYDIYA